MERGEGPQADNRLTRRTVLILCVVALVIGLGAWGFHRAHVGWDDALYQAVRLLTLQSGDEVHPVPWQLEVARFLGILADVAVLTAFTSFILFGRDVPNRFRRRTSSDHTIVCGAGVHGARMVRELDSKRVVVIDVDDQSPGMKEPTGSREVHLVDDAVRPETLRRAGLAKASRLMAVTGDDFVNSQIVSTARALAAGGEVRPGLEVFVQIEDPELARSLEEGERSDGLGALRVHVFTPNALAAGALFGEGASGPVPGGESAVLSELESQGRPHLMLAGDHPILEAVILGELRRSRARMLRRDQPADNAQAFLISLIGPGAVARVDRLIRFWSPEPEALELEADDVDTRDAGCVIAATPDTAWLRARTNSTASGSLSP